MLKSMTAYGRASLDTEVGHFIIDIQSVNRKFLEIQLQLPPEIQQFDPEVKKWIHDYVTRGQVNVKVSISFQGNVPFKIRPNLPLARQLKQAWEEIAQDLNLSLDDLSLSLLKDTEDLLIYEENHEYEEMYRRVLKESLESALKGFMQMKELEGVALQKDMAERIEKMRQMMKTIQEKVPFAPNKYRDKLLARLEELLPGHIENEEKVLREIALFADKLDITEEITRFFCHLTHFEELMDAAVGSVGKTLEFLLQELHREINTVGSKSSDLEIARLVIDIKSEVERIREQIQNVE